MHCFKSNNIASDRRNINMTGAHGHFHYLWRNRYHLHYSLGNIHHSSLLSYSVSVFRSSMCQQSRLLLSVYLEDRSCSAVYSCIINDTKTRPFPNKLTGINLNTKFIYKSVCLFAPNLKACSCLSFNSKLKTLHKDPPCHLLLWTHQSSRDKSIWSDGQ